VLTLVESSRERIRGKSKAGKSISEVLKYLFEGETSPTLNKLGSLFHLWKIISVDAQSIK